MTKKYKVSFEIEGENLADGMTLNKSNLKLKVFQDFDLMFNLRNCGDPDVDTTISNVEIEKIKGDERV